jgi:uncharacterized membrane-anchored protein YitT (DUF2179 family)
MIVFRGFKHIRTPSESAKTPNIKGRFYIMKNLLNELSKLLLTIAGVLSAGMGLNGFLLSSNFIDGGVTGVSMLLAKTTGYPLSIWLPLINLPFIIIGYKLIGRAFAIRSIFAISALALALAFVPYPDVTPDLLLTAVFGGFFLGGGIGLTIRGGAVLDGTEIAALIISKWGNILKVGDIILIFNTVLFTIAMAILGVQEALYSVLTYVAAAKTLNFVLYGLDEYTAITIISSQNPSIRKRIIHDLGRGVTVYKGYGGMSGVECEVLYCVVTRLEIGKVKQIAKEIDQNAFIALHALTGAEGGVIKRRALH